MSSPSAVRVGPSGIHGLGVFTTRGIDAGATVLVIDDSRIVDAAHPLRAELGEHPYHCDYLAEGRVVLMASPERHINSSCDPNTFVARRRPSRRRTARFGRRRRSHLRLHDRLPWGTALGLPLWEPHCLRSMPSSVFDCHSRRFALVCPI